MLDTSRSLKNATLLAESHLLGTLNFILNDYWMRLHSRPQCWRSYAQDFVRSNTEELWDRVGLSGFARRISTSSPVWRWAGNQGDFERLLVAIIFVKTHCILDFFSSCLPSQGHTSFSERTIDTFPKILCLGPSSCLRCVDRRKFEIHFTLL